MVLVSLGPYAKCRAVLVQVLLGLKGRLFLGAASPKACSCLDSCQFLFVSVQKRVAGVYAVHMHSGQQAVGVVHLQGSKDSHVTLWLHSCVAYHKACMYTSFHPRSSRLACSSLCCVNLWATLSCTPWSHV